MGFHVSADLDATSGTLYATWFDQNVAAKYHGFLDGETCYKFRCSLLHQGTTQHATSPYSRIVFVEPSASTATLHNNIFNNVLNIDVRIFCCDIVASATAWLTANETTPIFLQNYPQFIRRYPNGIAPIITGVPVIG